MESFTDPAAAKAQLDEIERLSTVPWTEYEDFPLWVFPAIAAFLTSMMASLHLMWSNSWWIIAVIGLLVLEGAALGFLSQRRKASPHILRTPQQFRSITIALFVGIAVIVGVTIVLMDRVNLGVGATFCFVASLVGMLVHRNRYERIASGTRASFAQA